MDSRQRRVLGPGMEHQAKLELDNMLGDSSPHDGALQELVLLGHVAQEPEGHGQDWAQVERGRDPRVVPDPRQDARPDRRAIERRVVGDVLRRREAALEEQARPCPGVVEAQQREVFPGGLVALAAPVHARSADPGIGLGA
jgi:hypothetical protein